MKRLLNTFIAASLLAAFSVPALADEGVDLVSTDGAICSERSAGKAVDSDKSKEAKTKGSNATNG